MIYNRPNLRHVLKFWSLDLRQRCNQKLNLIFFKKSNCNHFFFHIHSCFATFPHPSAADNPTLCIFDQILGTAILLFLINAVTDRKSEMKVSPSFVPVIVGVLVIVIGQTFGVNYAYAINPARDLGPRIYMAIFGWKNVFGCRAGYFLIPVFGPIIGAIFGTFCYRKSIGGFGGGELTKESDVFISWNVWSFFTVGEFSINQNGFNCLISVGAFPCLIHNFS